MLTAIIASQPSRWTATCAFCPTNPFPFSATLRRTLRRLEISGPPPTLWSDHEAACTARDSRPPVINARASFRDGANRNISGRLKRLSGGIEIAFNPRGILASVLNYFFAACCFSSSCKTFFLASSGFLPDALAASSNVLLVMFLELPMSSSGFWHPQL